MADQADLAGYMKRRTAYVRLIVLVFLVFSLIGLQLWFDRTNEREKVAELTEGYAGVMAMRLDAALRRADAALLGMLRKMPEAALDAGAAAQHAVTIGRDLDARTAKFPEVTAFRIFDAQGDLLYSSGGVHPRAVNIADQAHFIAAKTHDTDRPIFSDVLVGPLMQRSVLVMARPFRDGQGRFLGLAAAIFELQYFEMQLSRLKVGAGGVGVIRRIEDGRAVVRWPLALDAINQPLRAAAGMLAKVQQGQRSGTEEFVARSDGVQRVYGFSALGDYPFYVAVGVATDDVMAQWRKTAWTIGASALLVLSVFMQQLIWLWRAEARARETDARLAVAQRRTVLLASAFEHSNECVLITDADNCIVEVNPAFTRLTGYSADEVRGRNPRMLASGRTTPAEYRAMWDAIAARGHWSGEIWDRAKNGAVYPKWLTISVIRDAQGRVQNYVGNFIEISERKKTEEQIAHLAYHDALTGLPNRQNLQQRLGQVLAMTRREGSRSALMFLDLDRFKEINDQWGHHVGDELLKEVAHRLVNNVRDSDIVARLGGDEFVVVLAGVDQDSITRVAANLLAVLGRPYEIEGQTLQTSSSIGVALYPRDGRDAIELMRHADTAMYHAKRAGRNAVRYFGELAMPSTVPGPLTHSVLPPKP